MEAVAGIDHRGSSRQGLELLLQATPNVFIFRDNRQDHTFHTKLYLFERSDQAVVYVGSSNLTAGGLYSNYETNVRFDFDLTQSSEQAKYQSLLDVFQQAKLYALTLDATLLADIESRGWLDDEDHSFRPIPVAIVPPVVVPGTPPPSIPPSPFPRIPIPTAPRRSRTTQPSRPRTQRTPVSAALPIIPSISPTSTFLMTLQKTDITTGDRSPDVWVPLEARDANPAFWQWPARYNRVTRCSGTYEECYFRMVINFARQSPVQEDVRVYSYIEKSEFRINTDKIRTQAPMVGDILQIDRVEGTLGYEYEITIIPQSDPAHAGLVSLTQKIRAGNSQKRYAYI